MLQNEVDISRMRGARRENLAAPHQRKVRGLRQSTFDLRTQ
jgi:hypothetical protein